MMNIKLVISALSLFISAGIMAQTNDQKAIEKTVKGFAIAGDENNADELNKFLDPNYHIAMNQLFGSTDVSIMPRDVYLGKIRTKEFGGDSREVIISNVLINGNTASALVTMNGTKMNMISIMTFVKNNEEKWLVLSDMPIIK